MHPSVLFGLGDVIAQFISVEKGEKFKLDLPVSVHGTIFAHLPHHPPTHSCRELVVPPYLGVASSVR